VYADPLALVPLLFLDYDSVDADPASGRRYFVFCNQVGAPVAVQDDRGQKVWQARLDPYGGAHVDPSSTIDLALRFPGHYCDAETGLHYNRFRYYSPQLGRYLQGDPLGIAGGLNLYAYPANPLAKVDVRGLMCPPGDPPAPPPPPEKPPEQEETEPPTAGAPPAPVAEEPDPRAGITAQAAAARAEPHDERPTVVAESTKEGTEPVQGQSGTGDKPRDPVVQAALDDIPPNQRSPYHGSCGEVDAMSTRAADARSAAAAAGGDEAAQQQAAAAANENSEIRTAKTSTGQNEPPCKSCQGVMARLGAAHNPN
jgi:RHS repeat-associated protein